MVVNAHLCFRKNFIAKLWLLYIPIGIFKGLIFTHVKNYNKFVNLSKNRQSDGQTIE